MESMEKNQNVTDESKVGLIWEEFLFEVSKQTSASAFDVWIKSLEPVCVHENLLILCTNSIGSKNILEKNYKKILEVEINKLLPSIQGVEIVVEDSEEFLSYQKPVQEKVEEKPHTEDDIANSVINPKYTFENFVVGGCNQYTVAAAVAVADEPGKKFNPLFIYGGVGLGKTHLLHAIANKIKQQQPSMNVIYVTTEQFTNDLIESIKTMKNYDFRAKYRNADVLIVDDIQSISSKTATQEEFFHTFNELTQKGKQIIISSDKPPKNIALLEERLRSRFEWGLITDIGFPDIETRIAILKKKVQIEKYNVTNEVIEFIAEAVKTNVREMEGLLTRAVFYAPLVGSNVVTLDTAKEALKNYLNVDETEVKTENILDIVSKYYNISKTELKAKKRTKDVANARQICMYLISEYITMPLSSIGDIFGKDHATVIYAKSKVEKDMKTNKKIEIQINDLKSMIKNQ